jgi:hypothetical protein
LTKPGLRFSCIVADAECATPTGIHHPAVAAKPRSLVQMAPVISSPDVRVIDPLLPPGKTAARPGAETPRPPLSSGPLPGKAVRIWHGDGVSWLSRAWYPLTHTISKQGDGSAKPSANQPPVLYRRCGQHSASGGAGRRSANMFNKIPPKLTQC